MQQNTIPLHRVFHGIDLRLTRLVVAMTINFFAPYPSTVANPPSDSRFGARIDIVFGIIVNLSYICCKI